MSLQRRIIVDIYRTVRELAGGAFQNVPSSEASFISPETSASTEHYYQSSTSGARDRIKLLKLIWDLIGTEYGGRQLQYEMFYSAAQPVVNRRMFGAYDWRSATVMVDRLLGEY
jgi:4-hydroxyphenylacetate 3-monooxygenase